MRGKVKRRVNVASKNSFSKIYKVVSLITCWGSILTSIPSYVLTNSLTTSFLFLIVTPIRYFLFDIFPNKGRPLQFDKSIPLTILMHYWIITYPIPGGKILARMIGITLAGCRALYNGYGLLLFETFHFIKLKKSQEDSINSGDVLESHSESSHGRKEEIIQAEKNWKETYIKTKNDVWNFPVRRYLFIGDQDFKIQEIGAQLIDSTIKKEK